MSELSSRLNDEEEKNRQLTAQISTLETTHDADAAGATSSAADTDKQREEDENSWPEDSDDEFGFPGLRLYFSTL